MDQFLKEVEELVGVTDIGKDDDEEVHPYGELDEFYLYILFTSDKDVVEN